MSGPCVIPVAGFCYELFCTFAVERISLLNTFNPSLQGASCSLKEDFLVHKSKFTCFAFSILIIAFAIIP